MCCRLPGSARRSARITSLEWLPWLDSGACSAAVPSRSCGFGNSEFISLPYLALSAFLAVATLVWLAAPARGRRVSLSLKGAAS